MLLIARHRAYAWFRSRTDRAAPRPGDAGAPSVNRLSFSITAVLVGSMSEEPVNFDAVLQPSTLQYSIRKAGRAGAAAASSTMAGA